MWSIIEIDLDVEIFCGQGGGMSVNPEASQPAYSERQINRNVRV